MAEEDRYVERERPADHADLVLSGADARWLRDPDLESTGSQIEEKPGP